MSLFDQKFHVYNNLSTIDFNNEVNIQSDLGYEVVSTSAVDLNVTVTYKRSKNLKYYYRLQDLETKINKLQNISEKLSDQIIEVKLNNDTSRTIQKMFAGILIFILLVLDLTLILGLLNGNAKFGDHILDILIQLSLHVIHFFWVRSIIRKGKTNEEEAYLIKIKEYKNTLLSKAKKISKEEKEI